MSQTHTQSRKARASMQFYQQCSLLLKRLNTHTHRLIYKTRPRHNNRHINCSWYKCVKIAQYSSLAKRRGQVTKADASDTDGHSCGSARKIRPTLRWGSATLGCHSLHDADIFVHMAASCAAAVVVDVVVPSNRRFLPPVLFMRTVCLCGRSVYMNSDPLVLLSSFSPSYLRQRWTCVSRVRVECRLP